MVRWKSLKEERRGKRPAGAERTGPPRAGEMGFDTASVPLARA
jgi:hypothetical protein